MAKIRVNQDYFDIKDFKPSLKIGANDVGNLSKKSASYSVNFKLPWTSRNKTLLNNIGETNINTLDSKGKVENVYIEFGIVTYKGFLRVVKTTPKKYYEVYFATDLADWTDLMKGKNLQSLNLTRYNHAYNVVSIIGSFTNTEGYIYAFINYGFWNEYFQSYAGGDKGDYDTKYNNYFPAVYDSTILRQCLNDIGWSIDEQSELLKEPRFQNQITPFSEGKFTYKEQDLDDSVAYSQLEEGGIFIPDDNFTQLNSIWSDALAALTQYEDNSFLWDDATFEYIVPFDGVFKIELLTALVLGSLVYTISVNGVMSTEEFTAGAVKTLVFGAAKGDRVKIFARESVLGSGKDLLFLSVVLSVTDDLTIPFNGFFSLAGTLPNLSQIDFITDIAASYGCIVSTNNHNNTVKFDLFKNIETKKLKAEDWTHKLDASQLPIIDYTTISSKYGKRNYFTYNQNSSEDNGNTGKTPVLDYNNTHQDINLGNGRFDIDNEFVKDSNTVYKSPFSSSIESSVGLSMGTGKPNQSIMFIPYAIKAVGFFPNTSVFTFVHIELFSITDIRKAIVRRGVSFTDLSNGESPLLGIGNDDAVTHTVSEVPYCYFVKKWKNIPLIDDVKYNLSYERLTLYNNDSGLLGDYYEALIAIINKGYLVKLKMRLTESDLINIDFTQPFRLNTPELNGLFIINKIPKLNDINESIDVELIKL